MVLRAAVASGDTAAIGTAHTMLLLQSAERVRAKCVKQRALVGILKGARAWDELPEISKDHSSWPHYSLVRTG